MFNDKGNGQCLITKEEHKIYPFLGFWDALRNNKQHMVLMGVCECVKMMYAIPAHYHHFRGNIMINQSA